VFRDERECGNLVLTFPIKKRFSTELLIDRTAPLYTHTGCIRDKVNKVILVAWSIQYTLR